ncbi:MAG TPA: anti-sigma factor [Blastocatellia bacterium]|jgi:anti-sigma factor RsiW
MVCSQCQELLSDYIDGVLELGEQVKMERHLADCDRCRAVRDDLLQIVHFSKQLPEQAPSAALWARIQTSLAEEQDASFWSRARGWWSRARGMHFDFTVPQMIASAAVLAIVISVGAVLARRDASSQMNLAGAGPVAASQAQPLSNPEMQQLERQINDLSQSIEEVKSKWEPEVRITFERNMSYIEQSLAECRHHLTVNPEDGVSQELMLNAYREKVRLMEGFTSF